MNEHAEHKNEVRVDSEESNLPSCTKNLTRDEAEIIEYNLFLEALEEKLALEHIHLESIIEEEKNINNYDRLSDTIINIVCEQAINQVAVVAGEDFIKENNGLFLDLRKEAHIQTAENFANGKIATHNQEGNYQEKYDTYQSRFVLDNNGDRAKNTRGEWKIKVDARKPFDNARPKGSKTVNIDHTIPVAEIMRDPKLNAFYSEKELIDIANSEKNLNPLDAEANKSKGDRPMKEWLDSRRNGLKPAERFNINEQKLREKDAEAREELDRLRDEGTTKATISGKLSQRQEAFRITGKALRTAILTLLIELIRNLIKELIKWIKSKKRDIQSFLDYMRRAIWLFFENIGKNILTAGDALATTVVTSLIGPIVGIIKKAWLLIKQGGETFLEVARYLQDPTNRDKAFQIIIMEIAKIVITGVSAGGALLLSELIEKQLLAIPMFGISIPMFGSLASVFGIFFGATISGIVGAIAINTLDQVIAKKRAELLFVEKGKTTKTILDTQSLYLEGKSRYVDLQAEKTRLAIADRHIILDKELDEKIQKTEKANELAERMKGESVLRIQRMKESWEG